MRVSDGLRSPRPSGSTEPSGCRATVQPPLELGKRDENPAAAPYDPKLVEDVLVEVVAADAEGSRRLVGAESQPSGRRSALLAPAAALSRRPSWWLEVDHLEFQLLRRDTRHPTSVADLAHDVFLG